jgi:hypothetical protein
MKSTCKHCDNGAEIEWADKYCQLCWEEYCSKSFFETVQLICKQQKESE